MAKGGFNVEKSTVAEWLKVKNLTEYEIDFLLTFIPTITYLQKSPDKKTRAFNMFKGTIPKIYR